MIEQIGTWIRVYQCRSCGHVQCIALGKGKVKVFRDHHQLEICQACGAENWPNKAKIGRARWNRKWWHFNWTFDRFEVKDESGSDIR